MNIDILVEALIGYIVINICQLHAQDMAWLEIKLWDCSLNNIFQNET